MKPLGGSTYYSQHKNAKSSRVHNTSYRIKIETHQGSDQKLFKGNEKEKED